MQGDWLASAPNNTFSPLYKYFLGMLYLVFGRNFYFIYMVQFCMGALGSVLVYLITRDLFGVRAGLIAFLGFALYSTEIIYEGILLRAAFITFLGLLSFYIVSRLPDTLNTRNLVLATLALSLFFQSRPNMFLCLPLVCVFLYKYFVVFVASFCVFFLWRLWHFLCFFCGVCESRTNSLIQQS